MKKPIFTSGRLYIFFLIVAAVSLQLLVRDYLQDDQRIVEAFRESKTNSVSSELRIQGKYPKVLITEKDQEKLLLYLAKGLGMQSYEMDGNKMKLVSENEKAKTSIVIVAQKNSSYVVIDVQLLDTDHVIAIKEKISQLYDALEIQPSCFIRMKGSFPGEYQISDMNETKDVMFGQLECDTKYAQKYAGGYEYYGYTPLLSESRKMRGQRINVQLQFEYDKENNRTIMNLAVPFFSQE